MDPQADVSLDDKLQKFWEMDSVPVESGKTSDSVMDHLKQTITFENGRYEIALLWKIDHPPLPNKLITITMQRMGLNMSCLNCVQVKMI